MKLDQKQRRRKKALVGTFASLMRAHGEMHRYRKEFPSLYSAIDKVIKQSIEVAVTLQDK